MKALDNLENYDIPAGFRFTAEQEVQFASDLKEIVHSLISIRGSKLHTRRYFNSHLRYTSNVQDSLPKPSFPPNPDETVEPYVPQPGEYTWNSDLLQPALLDILKPDQWSFGFVINYINADIAYREKKRYFKDSGISDELVKFALTFDIDEIRAQAKAIEDPRERVLFLNTKNTDFKIYTGLSGNEQEWAWEVVGSPLQALLEEAEKELKLAESQLKSTVNEPSKQGRFKVASLKAKNHINSQKHVLYDFSICSLPQFAFMRLEVHGGCLTDPEANDFAFESTIKDMFRHYYDPENNYAKENDGTPNYPSFVLGLLDIYSVKVQQLYRNNPRAGLKLLFEWMQHTTAIIDGVYQSAAAAHNKPKTGTSGRNHEIHSIGVWPLKLYLLDKLYQCFQIMYGDLKPVLSDTLAQIVPYNMWDALYEALKAQYTNQFGLEFAKRAVVKPTENRRRFSQVLAEQALIFCQQMSVDTSGKEDDNIFKNCNGPMTSLLHNYFADYIKRIQAESEDAVEIDQAIIAWLLALQVEVYDCYASRRNSISRQVGTNFQTEYSMMRFFFDICEKNVFDIALDYFQDSETIPLVPEKKTKEPEPADAQSDQTAPDAKPEPEHPKIQHTRRINYKKLYDVWNEKAFTATTLEEFTAAIDYADFSKMMERAENAGQRAGFIGAVKFIIKRLNQHLGSNWYYIACCSIGETPDDLNKLNDTTKQISKIDTKILSGSIK